MAERTGCVVIGGGLVGLAVAHELAGRGTPCRVIERGRIAGGTTSTTFAWLNATSKLEEDYHRLNVAGMEGHRRWARRWGNDVTGHRQPGCLMWARADTAPSLHDLEGTFDCLADRDSCAVAIFSASACRADSAHRVPAPPGSGSEPASGV